MDGMKKGLIIWNVILSAVTLFLLVMHFGSKKTKDSGLTRSGADTTTNNRSFRIAYFEMDSIAANFNLAKELMAELRGREDAINTEMSNRAKALEQKYNFYRGKAQAGTLTEAESEVARKEMEGMDGEMKNRRQQLDQEYNSYMMTKQNEIKTKIEDFLKEYNATKEYSYIVSYEQGLFYYRDTAYNITADVIKGLNEKYKPAKKG
jgi:outer membrane protein